MAEHLLVKSVVMAGSTRPCFVGVPPQAFLWPRRRCRVNRAFTAGVAFLTDMATDLNIHIMALAQINRDGDDLPKVKNLKETGNLEQDAHYIFLLHRDLTAQHGGNYDNDAVIGIAKNRGGRTGIANVKYNAVTTRFYDDNHSYAEEG